MPKIKPDNDDNRVWKQKIYDKKVKRMFTRSSARLLREQIPKAKIADKQGKAQIICNSRTVELACGHNDGDDKNKLLFVLALGLVPKIDEVTNNTVNGNPVVLLNRLDPIVEAKVKAQTRQSIFEILHESHTRSKQVQHGDLITSDDEFCYSKTKEVESQETSQSNFCSWYRCIWSVITVSAIIFSYCNSNLNIIWSSI